MDRSKLILDAREGSSESLDALLEYYRPYIFKLAEETIAPWLRARLSAADVTQGTIVQAWSHFNQFDGETSADFRGWLLAIFRNHLRDGVRRYLTADKRTLNRDAGPASPSLEDGSPGPADRATMEETLSSLLESIETLPDLPKQVVRMRYIESMSFAQIAERLDCSPDRARRIWLAAVDQLASQLDG